MPDIFRAGDRFRKRRTNGDLDLTIAYYGEQYVIYRWKSTDDGVGGEAMTLRPLFDEDCELIPKLFEVGKEYKRLHALPSERDPWKCYYTDDRAAVLGFEGKRILRVQGERRYWEEV